jgi:hypothetical protein
MMAVKRCFSFFPTTSKLFRLAQKANLRYDSKPQQAIRNTQYATRNTFEVQNAGDSKLHPQETVRQG